jgi:hypothetical protein
MATIENKTTKKLIKFMLKQGFNEGVKYGSNFSDIAYYEDSELFGKIVNGKVIAYNCSSEWESDIVLRNEDRGTASIGSLYTPVCKLDISDIYHFCKEELNVPDYEIYDYIHTMATLFFYK